MKKKAFYIIFSLFVLALLVPSCKCTRTDEPFIGKELVAPPEGFTGVIGAFTACKANNGCSALTNDTSNAKMLFFGVTTPPGVYTTVAFHATLSHRVTWFLTIKGRQSGATKTFTGTSQVIDETNTLWTGRADGLTFFKAGEVVDAKISYYNSDLSSSLFLKINTSVQNGPVNYNFYPSAPNKLVVLVDDYDQEALPKMRTTYSDAVDGNGRATFVVKLTQKVQESFSLHMHGTDNNGNGYLGGFSNENLNELLSKFPVGTHPDSLYYNAYVYGTGRPNTGLLMLVYESDGNTGSYVATKDDNYQYNLQIDWIGWKLVSIKYSDFRAATNALSGGNGNHIKEPNKIVGCAMELQSYPTPGLEVETYVDYINFSVGGPFVK